VAFVPFIVANRRNRYHRSRASGAILAGLIFCTVFGLLFFIFFNRSNGFTMIPIWPIISGLGGFLIFIVIIGVIASSMSTPSNKANEDYIKPYQYQPQERTQQYNPYKIRNSIQNQAEDPIYEEVEQNIPIISDINYCRYCGSKIDRDARFCHQCGIKL
jgi:hypothetical protein